ncbi:Heparan-alpha-glucosaminide N-acetyltransferase [Nymphaea thermarum]|nr:Heparan-alpha-glucosaminide N-acetyltransferase [Nymphaea thermarum]
MHRSLYGPFELVPKPIYAQHQVAVFCSSVFSHTNGATLCVFQLMIFVDDAGAVLPSIAHSPWNGVRLADFVMPFFLFIVGVSLALVYKVELDTLATCIYFLVYKLRRRVTLLRISNPHIATCKAALRSAKLFVIGIFLQGGYFHGVNNLTFGVDIEKIRWLGILQRIAVAYFFTALCEIWFTRKSLVDMKYGPFGRVFAVFLSVIYLGLLYGLYVPDWQFEVPQLESSALFSGNISEACKVNCAVRGDLGPACNAAGFIDRYIVGIQHLYKKPVYRNLEECMSHNAQESPPVWCHAPFDPEGILRSICRVQFFLNYLTPDCLPLNKSLYTTSYTLLTSGSAGLVDVYGCRHPTIVLEWMGRHSLSIYVLVASNLIFIAIQGFYWAYPENNILNGFRNYLVLAGNLEAHIENL